MASIITATTSSGLTQSADNSGVLQLASGSGNLVTVPSVTGTAMVSGNMPAFSVYLNGNQSVSGSTYTKVAFDTEVFDTASCYDPTTNYRFTPNVAGYYQINSGIIFASVVTYAQINIYKNGTQYQTSWSQEASSNYGRVISSLVYCNGTTDYIEIYGYVAATTPRFNGGSENTWFNGVLVRGA
jgi:hypothetical protein